MDTLISKNTLEITVSGASGGIVIGKMGREAMKTGF